MRKNTKAVEVREPTDREIIHEQHRVVTMGSRITQRLKTIRKPQKMYAFYKTLWAMGERKIAAQAKAKLQEMGVAL